MGLNIILLHLSWSVLGWKRMKGAPTLSLNWASPTFESPEGHHHLPLCLSQKHPDPAYYFSRSNPYRLAYSRPSGSWTSPVSCSATLAWEHSHPALPDLLFLNQPCVECPSYLICQVNVGLVSQHLLLHILTDPLVFRHPFFYSSAVLLIMLHWDPLGAVIYPSLPIFLSLYSQRLLQTTEHSWYANASSWSNFQWVSKTSTPLQRCCNHV